MSDKDIKTKEGENETPTDTLSGKETTEPKKEEEKKDVSGVSSTAESSEVPEEWKSLSGKTQERIKKLIRERNELMQRTTSQANDDKNLPMPNPPVAPEADEVAQAMDTLVKRGVATKEEARAIVREELGTAIGRLRTDSEHDRLEREHNGSDGLPKYDREEIEEEARRTGNYDLEAVYRNMYWDEHMDFAARKKGGDKGPTNTSSERPTAKVSQESLTVEKFREKLSGPEGLKYYEKLEQNPRLLDKLVRELTGLE